MSDNQGRRLADRWWWQLIKWMSFIILAWAGWVTTKSLQVPGHEIRITKNEKSIEILNQISQDISTIRVWVENQK